MSSTVTQHNRRAALDRAIASSRMDGMEPSQIARAVYAAWLVGHYDTEEAVALLVQHYRESKVADSDGKAKRNELGLTDSGQLKAAEADIATLRMADLLLATPRVFPSVTKQPEHGGYDARAIQRLEGLEPVRRRPQSYFED